MLYSCCSLSAVYYLFTAYTERAFLQPSRLFKQPLRHLLLYQYSDLEKARNANHWAAEIISFRNQINEDLSTNIRNHLEENFSIIYSNALDYVKAKTNLTNLPQLCPYTLEQILDKNWLA